MALRKPQHKQAGRDQTALPALPASDRDVAASKITPLARLGKWGDFAGMAAAAICLVHCLGLPLLLVAFPLLAPTGGHAGAHSIVHDVLLAAIALPVLLSLVPAYLVRRDRVMLALGAGGLAIFLMAIFVAGPLLGEGAETALAVLSSLLLLTAHIRNYRACKRCAVAHGRALDPC